VIKTIKEKFAKFLLEITLFLISAIASILWTMNSAQATGKERVNGLEKQIEILRIENRQDHQTILGLLRK
jgi:hypothetical protein